MANHKAIIEAVLFAAGKPLLLKKLSALCGFTETEIQECLNELRDEYANNERGITLIEGVEGFQLGTTGAAASAIAAMTKDETTGELTKAQMETLSIIAYRGPITKGTLEEIRGVNCGMILRNLLIRGLISEAQDGGEKKYAVSLDLIRLLGVQSTKDLPDYAALSTHEALEAFLKSKEQQPNA